MNHPLLIRVLVCLVFFVSGAAALVYEILWSRQFVTVFGNSAYSISIVLSAFMAGLGVGGIYFGRRADRTGDPLRLYAFLELGIAGSALLIPFLLDLLRAVTPALFAALPTDVISVSAVRLLFTFLVLFVPCVLIGGTLPILARFCVDAEGVVGRRIGLLYGLNTLGGAFGCMLAGYYLIETFGISLTGYIAVVTNATIAVVALLLRRVLAPTASREESPVRPPPTPIDRDRTGLRSGAGILLALAFLSGFSTLCCEVLWARFISFVCHSNPYTFTALLGLFLMGLGMGSLVFRFFLAPWIDRTGRRGCFLLLGVVQVVFAAAGLAALLYGTWLIISSGPKAQAQLVPANQFSQRYLWPLFTAFIFVFIPSVVIGVVFPLICAAFARTVGTVGRSVGLVYGLNTAGCIVGSLAPVFVLIPLFEIQNSLLAVLFFNGLIGALLIWFLGVKYSSAFSGLLKVAGASILAIALLLTCIYTPRDLTQKVFLKGVMWVGPESEIIHYGEGRTGTSIVVRDKIDGFLDLFINSVNEVPTTFLAQGIFRLMGHLGPLLHHDPGDVLVICFGGGIAAGALNLHPAVKSLDIVDLESSVVDAARLLWVVNNNIHDSEKIEVFIEDGRNFLLTRQKEYPLILCDSTHPKAGDSWVLYTREFYQLMNSRLADPGVFIQWLPYHGISDREYRIIFKTFQETFPHSSLWMFYGYNEKGSLWGHTLMVAMKPTLEIDVANMARRIETPAVKADLARFEMDSPLKILRHFVCGEDRLRRWTDGLPVNTDDMPLTQYQTAYSSPPMSHHSMFIPLLESPWPYLVHADAAGEGGDLKDKLDHYMKARELTLKQLWKDAHELLPGDGKLRLFERILKQSERWKAIKKARFPPRGK